MKQVVNTTQHLDIPEEKQAKGWCNLLILATDKRFLFSPDSTIIMDCLLLTQWSYVKLFKAN